MKPTILVTGAGGNFSQVLIPRLIGEGFAVRALDVRRLDYDCDCLVGSVSDRDTLRLSMHGIDTVVHAAGLHNQLPRTPERTDAYDQFFRINIEGTHNLFRSASEAGVTKVVFISSMVYYAGGYDFLDEDGAASRPANNYYDLSKVLGEDIARFYAYRHGIKVVSLRPGNFTGLPEPGIDFLGGRLRREDVAQAAYLSIGYDPEPEPFEPFTILAGNPFSADDVAELRSDPMAVLERYYPGATGVLRDAGVTWKGLHGVASIRRARERLGYEPEYTFETYLSSLGYERP